MRSAASARVALAVADEERARDDEREPVLEALRARGVPADAVDWESEHDWSAHELVVVRSVWNYTERRPAFVAWAHRVETQTRLRNSAAVVEDNSDKAYLGRLASAGVPVVPTRWFSPRDALDLAALCDVEGWTECVVKPSVSAGARDTARARRADLGVAQGLADRLLVAGRAVMVQPYVASVDVVGETGLIYLGGHYSHGISKNAVLEPGVVNEALPGVGATTPTDEQLAVAGRVLAAATTEPLLYARVDLMDGEDGPLLSEVELTEPYLFLRYDDGAVERFVDAICAELG